MKLTKKVLSLIVEKATTAKITDVLFNLIDDNYEVNEQAVADFLLGDTSEFKTENDFDADVLLASAKDWMYSPSTLIKDSVIITTINNIRNFIVVSYADNRFENNIQSSKVSFTSYNWYEKEYNKNIAAANAPITDAE